MATITAKFEFTDEQIEKLAKMKKYPVKVPRPVMKTVSYEVYKRPDGSTVMFGDVPDETCTKETITEETPEIEYVENTEDKAVFVSKVYSGILRDDAFRELIRELNESREEERIMEEQEIRSIVEESITVIVE